MVESQSAPGRAGDLRQQGVRRGEALSFTFDGDAVQAFAGESVAAALLASGVTTLRRSLRDGAPRGVFCWMGLCQECTVTIDGVRLPACRVEARQGLTVNSGTIA